MGRCGLWSRPTTGKGEGKGAEETSLVPNAYVEYCRGEADRACSLRSGTVLRESGGQNRTLSPSVRLTRTAAKNRGYPRGQKQAGDVWESRPPFKETIETMSVRLI